VSIDKIEQEVMSSMTSEAATSPNYEMMMSARNVVMSLNTNDNQPEMTPHVRRLPWWDSNPQPLVNMTNALTAELQEFFTWG
jgi:hypothetical protein